jgi:hypothetical protein
VYGTITIDRERDLAESVENPTKSKNSPTKRIKQKKNKKKKKPHFMILWGFPDPKTDEKN